MLRWKPPILCTLYTSKAGCAARRKEKKGQELLDKEKREQCLQHEEREASRLMMVVFRKTREGQKETRLDLAAGVVAADGRSRILTYSILTPYILHTERTDLCSITIFQ